MWMLLIEVLLVLAILAAAVWWTMFSGRGGGHAEADARTEAPTDGPGMEQGKAQGKVLGKE